MYIALLSACTIRSFNGSLVSNSKGHTKNIPLNNQPYKARPTLVKISNELLYFSFTASVNEYGKSCNAIDILKYVFQIK